MLSNAEKTSPTKKVLLVNPPGRQLYIRDYYCSKVSKADYIYHPVDLLMLSGWLHRSFTVQVLDCIAQRIGVNKALEQIRTFAPDAIVFLTGSVSKPEDFAFLDQVKKESGAILVGSGDYLLENHQAIAEEAPWLDAIVLDFMGDDVEQFLKERLYGEIGVYPNVVKLQPEFVAPTCGRAKGAPIDIPIPRYELFPNNDYNYPFVTRKPFATVLTDYGCPYRCQFCVQVGLGFKLRGVENVLAELDYIKELGFKDIYFTDQTFGYKKKRLRELCQKIIDRKYGFRWVAFTRADVIDEETLLLMKRAGCHMLMFGVENPNQRVLDENKKDLKIEQIEEAFALCGRVGIKTLATFIIGLPGTSYEENMGILAFAKKIDADYASFNVLIPRVGTDIRREAKLNNWIVTDDDVMDQSGTICVMKSDTLSVEQITELRRKIIFGFYFRPRYIFKRLLAFRSGYEIVSAMKNGLAIGRSLIRFQPDPAS